MIIAQCVYVKCLLEGKAIFDAGTNWAASRRRDTEAEMKAEEEFRWGGACLGMDSRQRKQETVWTKAWRCETIWPFWGDMVTSRDWGMQ